MKNITRLAVVLCILIAPAIPLAAQNLLWRTSIKAPTVGNPVVGGDGSVYIACEDQRVRAYDPKGNPTWTFILKANPDGQMALQNGVLYIPTRASAIEAVGTNGHRAWEYRVGTHIVGAPVVASTGQVLFAMDDGILASISSGGLFQWDIHLPAASLFGPVLRSDGTLVVGYRDGFMAYDLRGRSAWPEPLIYLGNLAAPLAAGPTGQVLALCNDGILRCLGSDGSLDWELDVTGGTLPPLVAADRAYIAAGSTIYSIELATGESDWEQAITASGCPAIGSDGILYVPVKGTGSTARTEDVGPTCTTDPGGRSDAALQNIYTISGTITGAQAANVYLTGSSEGIDTADADGDYSFPNLYPGVYTVTPRLTGYSFSPTNHAVTISDSDVTGKDFTANTAITYAISGKVTLDGIGVKDVTVSTSGVSAKTDTDGAYTLTGLPDGTYTVTPSKPGYRFSPSDLSVTIEGGDQTGQDFEAMAVSGNVKLLDVENGGEPLPTELDIRASGKDLALVNMESSARLVALNSYPKLFCFEVSAGPLADAWSQAGAGPRRQNRMDTAPQVTLEGLTEGETVSGTVAVEASVSDTDIAGVSVRLIVDGAVVSRTDSPPFAFTWHTEGTLDGPARVAVEAVDLSGNAGSDSVSVLVHNGAPPPLTFYTDDFPQTFTWQAPADETRFKVECARDQGFQQKVATSVEDKGRWLTTPSWTPSRKAWRAVLSVAKGVAGEDTAGFWRILGKTAGSFYSATYIVAAQEPAAPTGPPDGSTVSASTPPSFTWVASHNAGFRVEFSDSADFSSGVKADSATKDKAYLPGQSWHPSKKKWSKIAAIGTTVYWRVKAVDSIGRTTSSSPVYSLEVH